MISSAGAVGGLRLNASDDQGENKHDGGDYGEHDDDHEDNHDEGRIEGGKYTTLKTEQNKAPKRPTKMFCHMLPGSSAVFNRTAVTSGISWEKHSAQNTIN